MTSRRMPVIPYTLRVTCLWREFRLLATLSGSLNRRAHEALQMDHLGGRRGGDCALLLYVHRARQPGMHRLRGISGSLELRHRRGNHRRRGHGDGAQHRVWTGGVRLIAKARTVFLTVHRTEPQDTARLSAAKQARLEVTLADGTQLNGWATLELPQHHSRVLDYLNAAAEPFFAIATDDGVHLVNRAHVLYARPED